MPLKSVLDHIGVGKIKLFISTCHSGIYEIS